MNGYQTRQGSGNETAKKSSLIACCWCRCHSHRDRFGSDRRMGTVWTKQPDGCNRRCVMHGFGRMAGVAYHVASDAASTRPRDAFDMALACLVGSYVFCPYALGVASGAQTGREKGDRGKKGTSLILGEKGDITDFGEMGNRYLKNVLFSVLDRSQAPCKGEMSVKIHRPMEFFPCRNLQVNLA